MKNVGFAARKVLPTPTTDMERMKIRVTRFGRRKTEVMHQFLKLLICSAALIKIRIQAIKYPAHV